jgi:hypothetical protein
LAQLLVFSRRWASTVAMASELWGEAAGSGAAGAGSVAGAGVAVGGGRPGGRVAGPVGIVWYQYSDLRVADHAPLTAAMAECASVVPLFVWEPWWHSATSLARLPRMGHHRAAFLAQCVADLREVRRAPVG